MEDIGWVSISYLSKITGLSTSTMRTYVDSFWFNKYRRPKMFYICKNSLDLLYSYLFNKGVSNDRIWEGTITLKKNFPTVKKISMEQKECSKKNG